MEAMRAVPLLCLVAVVQSCNPLTPHLTKVRTLRPDALAANAPGEMVFLFDYTTQMAPAVKAAGVRLYAQDGNRAADVECHVGKVPDKYELGGVEGAICPMPALAVGSYQVEVSADPSCGDTSYKSLEFRLDVIEPAHISAVSPAHGPEKQATTVVVSGSNIGGPHVGCQFTFPPAPGAKFGCSMEYSSAPAAQYTPTSATCTVPQWPGPLTQYDGKGGFHPVPGSVCSRDVIVTITNEARVSSLEPVTFHYDAAAAEVLV